MHAKLTDIFRIAEIAIEIQFEKSRVEEVMAARDILVQKLSDAYTSLQEKTERIEQLQQALSTSTCGANILGDSATHSMNPSVIENTVEENGCARIANRNASPTITIHPPPHDLTSEIIALRAGLEASAARPVVSMGPPPKYEEEERKHPIPREQVFSAGAASMHDPKTIASPASSRDEGSAQSMDETEAIHDPRFAILASIPLPESFPDDTLDPIILPPTCTLHEFLNSMPMTLRNQLGNYRVLYSLTTKWCPTREEHGYFYSPLFKCTTNPRAITAHRWHPVDVVARMKHPTECFYNREGLWYYAGSYQAFRLEDLTVKEWNELSTETANFLVKETIAGRKNITPQNIYEVNQLYDAGALRIACVALQCVGFNQEIYRSILHYAVKFMEAKQKTVDTINLPAPSTIGNATPTEFTAKAMTRNVTPIPKQNATSSNLLVADKSFTGCGVKSPKSRLAHKGPNTVASKAGFMTVATHLGLDTSATWDATVMPLGRNNFTSKTTVMSSGGETLPPVNKGGLAEF